MKVKVYRHKRRRKLWHIDCNLCGYYRTTKQTRWSSAISIAMQHAYGKKHSYKLAKESVDIRISSSNY